MNFRGHVTRVVAVEEVSQVGQARREALALAVALQFDETDAGRVALAATELATNLMRHGGGGRLYLSPVEGRGFRGVELLTLDAGPGFNLVSSLPDGVSTGGSQGLGLGAIRRQSSLFDAWSDARGCIVVARIYPSSAPADVDRAYGAVRLPIRDEQACGDAWHLGIHGERLTLTVIDGLGHGIEAAGAAQAGTAEATMRSTVEAEGLIGHLHTAMSGTRGGAVAVASIENATVTFAGIGNISASLITDEASRGLASMPGIVGAQFRKVQAFRLHAAPGSLLLMHSDGLQSRWNLRDYPGLLYRHPALVVAVLQRDFDRGRDDVCIVAVRTGGME